MPIGRTLILAILGLPIAVAVGLYWRYFPPLQSHSAPNPILTTGPIIAEAPAEG